MSAMPDSDWLAASVAAMSPGFCFLEPYDFTADTGWCPCRVGGEECGFEWELDQPEQGAQAQARLHYRSSNADATSAILVSANIAALSGGTLTAPDGLVIGPDDALKWASTVLRKLKSTRKTSGAKRPRTVRAPEESLHAMLGGMVGLSVEAFVRSLPDDPLITIRYGKDLLVRARRWTLSENGGQDCGTLSLPRLMRKEDIAQLDEAVQRLIGLLRSGAVVSAGYQPESRQVSIAHPAGVFRLYPAADEGATAEAMLHAMRDRWEIEQANVCVRPQDSGNGVETR